MWIWFADSIPALVGFLRLLQFPPTPKNRNPFIFLVNSFWSLVVCIKPACLPEVWLPMCALRLSHSSALRTQWVDMSRVTKTANYCYYHILVNLMLNLVPELKPVLVEWKFTKSHTWNKIRSFFEGSHNMAAIHFHGHSFSSPSN